MGQTSGPRGYRGGCAKHISWRGIVANPNGNREQRRAAKKLGVAEPVTRDVDTEDVTAQTLADDGDEADWRMRNTT